MKNLAKFSSALGCALLLSACATNNVKVSEFSKFTNASILDADVMPTEAQMQNERIKVIVLDADNPNDALARSAAVGASVSKAVTSVLGARGVEIIDTNVAPKLTDALRIAESKGATNYAGPKVANYVIKPAVTLSNYGAVFKAATRYQDKKGKVFETPASQDHKAEVKAAIRIYEMPSLKLVSTFNVDGTSTNSMDARQGAAAAIGTPMLTKAAESAVNLNTSGLLNFFANKGYVSEKRVNEKLALFHISMGTEDGIKVGDTTRIFTVRETAGTLRDKNPRTEEIFVAEGTVTENIRADESWILVKDVEASKKVRRGDIAKPQFQEGFLNMIQKAAS